MIHHLVQQLGSAPADLVKILPFAVLAIYLIDGSFFRIDESLEVLREAKDHRERVFYYLMFLIALEFALRLSWPAAAFLIAERNRLLNRRSVAGRVAEPVLRPEDPPSQQEAEQDTAIPPATNKPIETTTRE